jgi:hypothetical protein
MYCAFSGAAHPVRQAAWEGGAVLCWQEREREKERERKREKVSERDGRAHSDPCSTGADTSLLDRRNRYTGYKRHWHAELFSPEAMEERC